MAGNQNQRLNLGQARQHFMYYPNGMKKREFNYVEGKKNGPQLGWYDDGNKWYVKNYVARAREGEQTEWYRNGQVKSTDIYKDGKLNGTCRAWYKNGQLHEEIDFKNGLKKGTRLRLAYDGDTILCEIYHNNKLVERIK
jgi:antitoxin component YwqK of YwqJK toxin-antitoxin module